ncbi:DUF7529 family protein [Haladaptatus cibarius]|uniref:DUF7529 family protein n=1 Tax=Haladaptatus cibarius TaxID=453847 RepID=UPI0006791488|nr:hypothetical protein [Haladaptatus cibarius]
MDGTTPNTTAHSRAMPFWEDVLADMEATAEDYEQSGWDVVQLHPGDVTPRWTEDHDEFGLDVLVPNDEFDAVSDLLDSGVEFDAFEAFRATGDSLVFVVVVMEDHDTETAVCYPTYYDVRGAEQMLQDAMNAGVMYSFIRTLTEDRVRFTHDDPAVFQPPEPEQEAETDDSATDADE